MRSRPASLVRLSWCASVCFAVVTQPSRGLAFEFYGTRVPHTASAPDSIGVPRACITCHAHPDGGQGCVTGGGAPPCLNPFGVAFRANGYRWSEDLASLDSDGDGFSNGQELQDATGSWRPGLASRGNEAYVTRPGSWTDTPGDYDLDRDGRCWFGRDLDGDGDCSSSGENDGSFDCDDSTASIHSGAPENCGNEADDDCNGLATLQDPACVDIVDRDGDGFCPRGRDINRDRDCIDGAGEQAGDVDCDDRDATMFPGAPENCTDERDGDCGGTTDADDPMCRSNVDADGDGYCPIGRDFDGDGQCGSPGEAEGGFDCDDTRTEIHSAQTELCADGRDDDCNGFVDSGDPSCTTFYDSDGDGHCPLGEDLDGDGDCIDDGEVGRSGDCDDANASVGPRAREVCTDEVDHDCDGWAGVSDVDCATYVDADGDGYCFVGTDLDGDEDCADAGEEGASSDCDDTRFAVSPASNEACTVEDLESCGSSCTNGLDDDCDGSLDGFDPGCSNAFRDLDGDGWCGVGSDRNADEDCSDVGEQSGPEDAAPHDPTIYPWAPENCIDARDNDQDGLVDEGAYCSRRVDEDGDGWCPLGRDANGDGDCDDEGLDENIRASDCDEGDRARHPAAEEDCFNRRDDDCDGSVDLDDPSCFHLLDRDGDGFCGRGIDDNLDGDCLDDAENRFGEDCDDGRASVNVRATEVCANRIDDDCDGEVDALDSQCECPSRGCDDDDPCAADTCDPRGECANRPTCPDGGTGDAGVGPEPEGPGGRCSAGPIAAGWSSLIWIVAGIVSIERLARRRRRVEQALARTTPNARQRNDTTKTG